MEELRTVWRHRRYRSSTISVILGWNRKVISILRFFKIELKQRQPIVILANSDIDMMSEEVRLVERNFKYVRVMPRMDHRRLRRSWIGYVYKKAEQSSCSRTRALSATCQSKDICRADQNANAIAEFRVE